MSPLGASAIPITASTGVATVSAIRSVPTVQPSRRNRQDARRGAAAIRSNVATRLAYRSLIHTL